ncbi:hypothetical protein DH09_12680 [Bacillaceae bacterium JMAK1]|nr:hypothetical protein DH09_12680 [Bacillaceae bacterium JMAK1]
MKNAWFYVLTGWATVTIGLFLASFFGSIATEHFRITGDGRQVIHAVVMSGIVVPTILILYKKMNKSLPTPRPPAYSMKRAHHFFGGFLLAAGLAFVGLFLASALNLIEINQWNVPNAWIGALLLNLLIAFFYEALPEELALRGLIFDALNHRFAVFLAVLFQTIVFMMMALTVNFLQVLVGMSTFNLFFLQLPQLILLFVFGIALALIRIYTGSLWAAIGFHLGYLIMARFLIMPVEYGAPPIVSFENVSELNFGATVMIDTMIYGCIGLMLVLLLFRRVRRS